MLTCEEINRQGLSGSKGLSVRFLGQDWVQASGQLIPKPHETVFAAMTW